MQWWMFHNIPKLTRLSLSWCHLFQIFYPETTDVYDRKNMPKVIYCIHALRWVCPEALPANTKPSVSFYFHPTRSESTVIDFDDIDS